MKVIVLLASGMLVFASCSAWAAGPQITGPLPGYKCMMLNLTGAQGYHDQQDPDPSFAYSVPQSSIGHCGHWSDMRQRRLRSRTQCAR